MQLTSLLLNIFRTIAGPIVRRNTCIPVRTYRRAGNRKPRDQAGLRIQQSILNDWESVEQDPEVTYDADFNNLPQSHREHVTEMESRKEQIKYYTIRSKYFKTKKQPSFLTWAEKEQIRHLNKQNPREWTPERLSESFPATEEVIIKVLKANWTPNDMKRVQKHDEHVRKNWQLFKEGQFQDLDPEVQDHLKKFSNRNFDSMQNAYVQTTNDQLQFKFPKPKSKEFSQIVSPFKKKTPKKVEEGSKSKIEGKQQLIEDSKAMQLKLSKDLSRMNMTYDQLTEKVGNSKAEHNEEMHLSVSLPNENTLVKTNNSVKSTSMGTEISDQIQESQEDVVVNLTEADLSPSKIIQKFDITQSALSTKSQNVIPAIRHRIKIPSRLRQRGAIYKLYDCFYDDDGEFMYRVPGLDD